MKKLLSILVALFIAWGVWSYADILTKNVRPNPQYSKANMWVLMVEVTSR